MAVAGFWDNKERARKTITESNLLKGWTQPWREVKEKLVELQELGELIGLDEDLELKQEWSLELESLELKVSKLELKTMLQGEDDHRNALLTVHPGAGGLESQDWAEMLTRMYTKWGEQNGFTINVLDFQPGEEAGIKSATIEFSGGSAYGYLKSEKGVHRLVRISPFDAQSRRHTSFASVFVYPQIDEDLEIEVEESDLRIDTFRASGAGGQHVNKTDSAIRITHSPTGIVVECQEDRSQHKNKEKALSLLKAKLLVSEKEKNDAEVAQNRKIMVGSGDRSEKIRTYNFPQNRITDHRIEVSVHNLVNFLDGDMTSMISSLLEENQARALANLEKNSR